MSLRSLESLNDLDSFLVPLRFLSSVLVSGTSAEKLEVAQNIKDRHSANPLDRRSREYIRWGRVAI